MAKSALCPVLAPSLGYALAGFILAILVGLFFAKSAGLQGGKHALAVVASISIMAALAGASMARATKFPTPKEQWLGLLPVVGATCGLAFGSLLVINGAGLVYLGYALFYLQSSALIGLAFSFFFSVILRDFWMAGLVTVVFFSGCSLLALWGDGLVAGNLVSMQTLGSIGISSSQAMLLMHDGLGVDPFSSFLYMEQGYAIKDYGPLSYYGERDWLLYASMAVAILGWIVDESLFRLRRSWIAYRRRRVGLDGDSDDALKS